MQVVEQNIPKTISDQLRELPVSTSRALFVEERRINYAMRERWRVQKETGAKFKTKKSVQLVDNKIVNGINIWKINDGSEVEHSQQSAGIQKGA